MKESLGIEKGVHKMNKQTMFWILTMVQTIALIVSNITVCVFIPVFGGREFSIFGITFQLAITGAIFVFPITCIVDDLQTELYGRKNNLAMIVSFGIMWIVAGIFYLVDRCNSDPASSSIPDLWTAGLASTIAFLVSSLINSEVLIYLKKKHPKNMIIRFVSSTAVGQFFDTLTFTIVAVMIGVYPDWRLGWSLFPIEYLIKILYELIASKPIIIPLKNFIEKKCED
jgi:uncharacterized integral membrane protein (TIGR00697 family)